MSTKMYLLVDSHNALLYKKDSTQHGFHLQLIKKITYDSKKFLITKHADPGRTFDRYGKGRSAYEFSNLDEKRDFQFISEVCNEAVIEFNQGNFSNLVLIARDEIKILVKQLLPAILLKKIINEINKDYVKMPKIKLERQMQALEG